MPLRLRVVLFFGLVLLTSMTMGVVVAGYLVRQTLGAELDAGLAGASQTVASAFEDLPHSDHPARDLRQIVATFNGNRHVSAALVDSGGHIEWTSHTEIPGTAPPRWFNHLVAVSPAQIRRIAPPTRAGPAIMVLTPVPDFDVRAAWEEFVAVIGVLAAIAAAGLVLVYLVIGAALRPLTHLAMRFRQIGAGDYTGRVDPLGPTELMQLQRGFNQMADELQATIGRNRLLSDQLATLQEEERADIARDLHDEIGPHLFAANLDAEMILQCVTNGQHDPVPDLVSAIQVSVRHMQAQVRDLLGRLRPLQITEFGLVVAIEDLVRFWAARRPDIAFDVSASDDHIPDLIAEVAYRIVQEGVNNAVRHASPTVIAIAVEQAGDTLCVTVTNDGLRWDGGNAERCVGTGRGLVGMRERVEAGGGTLAHGLAQDQRGWTVAAVLSLSLARQVPIRVFTEGAAR